jgi:hypothetical protein
MRFFNFLHNLCLKHFLVLGRTERDFIINVQGSSCKVLVILIRFYENRIYSEAFRKILKHKNFMKIRPVGAELFHADGHTSRI